MARILGTTGSRRRRRYQLAALFAVVALLALIAVPASAVLPGSPSKFESGNDPTLGLGNMIVDNLPVPPATPHTDWISASVTGSPNYFTGPDAAAVTTDDSFTPGQKQDTTCPTVEGHKNPPKDDFTNVASFFEVASNGDVYLYGATIRYAANGNASENIELKQSSVLCPGQPTGGLTARTANDKMIAIDYLGGGKAVQFHVLTWVTGGACNVGNDLPPCWGATVLTLDPTVAEGGVNTTAITALQNPISGVPLVAGQFAEFGVNLTAAGIIPPGSCAGFAQTVWESRSSGSSFVSSTKDIVIENKTISSCASVSVTKVGSDGGSQEGVIFTLYHSTGSPPVLGAVVGTCTVNAAGDCVDPVTGLNPFTGLNPGQYTIDETNTPSGYTKDATLPFTFTLAQSQNLTLPFTDIAQNGAIKVTKTYKHAASGAGNHPQSGVDFTVNGVTKSTDVNGEACFDGLPQATYTVHETVPAGYHVDANDKQVTVDNAAKCSDATYVGETVSFHNTPLTDLTIKATSQVSGGTLSTITCVDSLASNIGNSPQGPSDPAQVDANDLEPGTYTCTVLIDP